MSKEEYRSPNIAIPTTGFLPWLHLIMDFGLAARPESRIRVG